jgi:CHAD domain-containing protein
MSEVYSITAEHLLAASTIARHANTMAKKVEGVREADDTEAIHDMRVASRRLRNALNLFEPVIPPRRFRKWRKTIKRVTKALGTARDLDVQLETLDELLDGPLSEADHRRRRSGVQRLRLRLAQQREDAQKGVLNAMDRLESSGVVGAMRRWTRQVRSQRLSADPDERPVRARAAERILLCLDEVMRYESAVDQPEQVEQLHAMRIAAKHLRYSMETYGSLFEDRLKQPIRRVRKIQTLLGDLHDCDVWLEFLPEFEAAETERHQWFFGHRRGLSTLRTGLAFLRDNRQALRTDLFEQFRRQWRQDAREEFWLSWRRRFEALRPPPAPPAFIATQQSNLPAEPDDQPSSRGHDQSGSDTPRVRFAPGLRSLPAERDITISPFRPAPRPDRSRQGS